MALEDLDFYELMRYARVQESRFSFNSGDPLINKTKFSYINKASSGSLTQEEFNDCLKNNFPEIISYIKLDSEIFNEENIISALKKNGLLLRYIPPKKQTKNIISAAFSQNGLSLEYAEENLLDNDLVKIAIRQNPECKSSLVRIYNESLSSSNNTDNEDNENNENTQQEEIGDDIGQGGSEDNDDDDDDIGTDVGVETPPPMIEEEEEI